MNDLATNRAVKAGRIAARLATIGVTTAEVAAFTAHQRSIAARAAGYDAVSPETWTVVERLVEVKREVAADPFGWTP